MIVTVQAQNAETMQDALEQVTQINSQVETERFENQDDDNADIKRTLDSLYIVHDELNAKQDSLTNTGKKIYSVRNRQHTVKQRDDTHSDLEQMQIRLSESERLERLEEAVGENIYNAGRNIQIAQSLEISSIGLGVISGILFISNNRVQKAIGYFTGVCSLGCGIASLIYHFKSGRELKVAADKVVYRF